jgi:hypothetical protein
VKFVRRERQREGPPLPHLRRTTEFGAAWKKTSRDRRDYLSVKLDDPSFPAPIYASLVESDGEGIALIWSRRAPTDQPPARPRASGASSCSYPPPQEENTVSCARVVLIGCGESLADRVGSQGVLPLAPRKCRLLRSRAAASQSGRSPRPHHIVIRSARLAARPRAPACALHPRALTRPRKACRGHAFGINGKGQDNELHQQQPERRQ